jgi:hypothetical protein
MQLVPNKLLKAELPIVKDFLRRDAETTQHETISIHDMSFTHEGEEIIFLSTDLEASIIRDYTVPQLLSRLGYAGRGYKNAFIALPFTSTQVTVLNDLLRYKQIDNPKEKWYVPISNLKQGKPTVKAFLSDQYSYVSTYKLNLAVEEAVADEGMSTYPVECFTSFTETKIRYVNPELQHIVNPKDVITDYDDVIEGGFELTNSETGHSAVRVMLMTYRALCRNMAVFGDKREDVTDRFIHRGINHDKVKRDVVDIVLNLEDKFKNLIPLMDKSAEMIIPRKLGLAYKTARNVLRIWSSSPRTTFDILLSDIVSRDTIDTVTMAFNLERGNTLWHYLNAINYATALKDVSKNDELLLQELFGKLLLELKDITMVDWEHVAEKIKPREEKTQQERDNYLIDELLGG